MQNYTSYYYKRPYCDILDMVSAHMPYLYIRQVKGSTTGVFVLCLFPNCSNTVTVITPPKMRSNHSLPSATIVLHVVKTRFSLCTACHLKFLQIIPFRSLSARCQVVHLSRRSARQDKSTGFSIRGTQKKPYKKRSRCSTANVICTCENTTSRLASP